MFSSERNRHELACEGVRAFHAAGADQQGVAEVSCTGRESLREVQAEGTMRTHDDEKDLGLSITITWDPISQWY